MHAMWYEPAPRSVDLCGSIGRTSPGRARCVGCLCVCMRMHAMTCGMWLSEALQTPGGALPCVSAVRCRRHSFTMLQACTLYATVGRLGPIDCKDCHARGQVLKQ